MRILVFSDSHGNSADMISVIEKQYDSINAVIHLGDLLSDANEVSRRFPHLPVNTVAGNCDRYGFTADDFEKCADYGGVKLFMCHGHTCSVKSTLGIITAKAARCGAKIALFGHTHVSGVKEMNGVILMNPGSITCPRDGRAPSYGIIEIENSMILRCETVFL